MIVSAFTNYPIDEVRAAAPTAVLWQNVYLWKGLEKTMDFVERAERLDFAAIVVSIDVATLSYRRMRPLGDKIDDIPEAHFSPDEVARRRRRPRRPCSVSRTATAVRTQRGRSSRSSRARPSCR